MEGSGGGRLPLDSLGPREEAVGAPEGPEEASRPEGVGGAVRDPRGGVQPGRIENPRGAPAERGSSRNRTHEALLGFGSGKFIGAGLGIHQFSLGEWRIHQVSLGFENP